MAVAAVGLQAWHRLLFSHLVCFELQTQWYLGLLNWIEADIYIDESVREVRDVTHNFGTKSAVTCMEP